MFKEKFSEGIISAKQFDREDIKYILKKGKEMIEIKNSNLLHGKILATLFFEPSTRTRLSFESAMYRLGGSVIGFHSGDVSSIKKGESIADTIRTVENYCDCIVMRHSLEGAATMAAKFAEIPIVNAGSGSGEHPTQALLDLHAIRTVKNKIDGLTIALVGDLLYGRTVHSLALALRNYDVNLYFVSPKELKMRKDVTAELKGKISYVETNNLKRIIPDLDVLYATRIQKER